MSNWTEALDAFEQLLDEVDERLRNGKWEDAVLPEGPDLPSHAPTASQRDRAVVLAQRYQQLDRRVRQATRLMCGVLGEFESRRDPDRASETQRL